MSDTPEKPFLILTLRRTGGTSLTTFMSAASAFERSFHEPFNVDRVWGQIVRDYAASQDIVALRESVAGVLAERPNIKHCFEIIPYPVTKVLIEVCAELGYKIYMLTRKMESKRLLSVLLAEMTGVWGPDQAAKVYPKILSGDRTLGVIPAEKARKRASMDATSIGVVVSMLRHQNVDYDWLVFEDLYFGDTPLKEHARRLARELGILINADDERLAVLGSSKSQDTGSIADHVPNLKEIMDIVRLYSPFEQ